jgi:DDE family transposase
MSDKWNIKKKGYLKIHIAIVNIKTKEILALEVTDEKVHDSKTIGKLVKHILDKTKNKIHSFIGDGAYDSNGNFRFLKD